MKAILLAGGSGSRLYPATKVLSKQLLTIYNKPLIYYSISLPLLASIKDILLISSPEKIGMFQELLGTGDALGISIKYAVQDKPGGIAQAVLLGESFLDKSPFMLVLGDNVLYANNLRATLLSGCRTIEAAGGSVFFGYDVNNPEDYGVAVTDKQGRICSLVEKPSIPESSTVIIGVYLYDSTAIEKAKMLRESSRGELEITDLNNLYVAEKKARLNKLGRGVAWFDCGTCGSLLDCNNFIAAVEKRQKLMIGCIEEIAYRVGLISKKKLAMLVCEMPEGKYKDYIMEDLLGIGKLSASLG